LFQRHLFRLALVLGMLLGLPRPSAAADLRTELIQRLSVRVSGGVAFFLSQDQLDWLGFQRPGFLADLGFSVRVQPWLSAELGGTIGIFMAGDKAAELTPLVPIVAAPGGLLAPWLGVRAHGTGRRLVPYLGLNFGPGFTGDLVRPVLQGSVGADIHVGAGASVGPVVGFSQVFQNNRPGSSTDARFLWVGLSFTYRSPPDSPPEKERHTHSVERVIEVRHVVEHEVQREKIYVPIPGAPVDDKELDELLDRALPAPRGRVELLAPVLFGFDSDALAPVGIAMLHEVADLLGRHTEIELVAIHGYADKRGGEEHNRTLARRRAERVRSWLTQHGIAAERLMVADGENVLAEEGESEGEHAQNRRVIFRVLRQAGPL
jgi:outer membrane protein OmpA-like peptidoglycan-associated protein